jgi:hypothetical protein
MLLKAQKTLSFTAFYFTWCVCFPVLLGIMPRALYLLALKIFHFHAVYILVGKEFHLFGYKTIVIYFLLYLCRHLACIKYWIQIHFMLNIYVRLLYEYTYTVSSLNSIEEELSVKNIC